MNSDINNYNQHFVNMVKEALECGLYNPIEWIVNYNRCTGLPYSRYDEVHEFVDVVSKDLFKLDKGREPKNKDEIVNWIDKYYSKGE